MKSHIGVAVVFAVGVVAFAQSPIAQIGVSEADAREWLQRTVEDNRPGGPSRTDQDPDIQRVFAAFKKLPASARGPLTTQLYAWAKGVLISPAFKARYLKTREERKLKAENYAHPKTVEQELNERVAQETADQEERWKQMEAMRELKDIVAQQRKEWPKQLEQLKASWKQELVDQRAKDKEDYDTGMAEWAKTYPVDPTDIIAKFLHDFLNATPDVDFAAKRGPVLNGSEYNFLNPAYWHKPWQWQLSVEWGPEAIGAARTAAQAWLKEMGK